MIGINETKELLSLVLMEGNARILIRVNLSSQIMFFEIE